MTSQAEHVNHTDWHWFDHPEMQARIEKAERDRREGRVERFDSQEAALRHLEKLSN